MTSQEMIDQVGDEIRNKKSPDKILRWINMTLVVVANEFIFGALNKNGTKATIAANPDVTLDNDFLWLKMIGIPSQFRDLYPRDESIIQNIYPDYRTQQGLPQWYYLNGNVLSLFQVPGAIYTLGYTYQRKPVTVTLSVSCDLPEAWHPYITQKSTTLGFRYSGNGDGVLMSQAAEKELFKKLGANIYRRSDVKTVLGSEGKIGTRPARPRLPANYPRIF